MKGEIDLEMGRKRTFRLIITLLLCSVFFNITIIVHEFGHIYIIIITGNEFLGVRFMEDGGFFIIGTLSRDIENPIERAFINLGGILFTLPILSIILCLSIKNKKIMLVNSALFSIFSEVFQLFISSIMLYGDLYNFFINLNLPILILQISSIPILIFSLFLLYSLVKFNHKNIDYYISPYYESRKYRSMYRSIN